MGKWWGGGGAENHIVCLKRNLKGSHKFLGLLYFENYQKFGHGDNKEKMVENWATEWKMILI